MRLSELNAYAANAYQNNYNNQQNFGNIGNNNGIDFGALTARRSQRVQPTDNNVQINPSTEKYDKYDASSVNHPDGRTNKTGKLLYMLG